jgi:hypothetical protein
VFTVVLTKSCSTSALIQRKESKDGDKERETILEECPWMKDYVEKQILLRCLLYKGEEDVNGTFLLECPWMKEYYTKQDLLRNLSS